MLQEERFFISLTERSLSAGIIPLNVCVCVCVQAEEERDGMEKVKLDNKRILFNLLPAHVAQHFLLSNPRNMVRGLQINVTSTLM